MVLKFPKIQAKDYSNTTLQQTSALLTQNPEYYTIWNHRRVLLQHVITTELAKPELTPHDTDNTDTAAATAAGHTLPQHEISLLLQEDLAFLLPLLKSFPKCYWIWNHRTWLLATATTHLPPRTATTFWTHELALVTKMLALDSRNFHGWGYRRSVVQALEKLTATSRAEDEFAYTTKMIHANLSNFSAWHQRGTLLPRLLRERDASSAERTELYDGEFELITTALYTDPYDQSLWFYHQFLMSALDAGNAQAPEILVQCEDGARKKYLEQEIGSVREMVEGAEDCKYVFQALVEYGGRWRGLGGEVEDGEMRGWLKQLREIDPLRRGRWEDLEARMGL